MLNPERHSSFNKTNDRRHCFALVQISIDLFIYITLDAWILWECFCPMSSRAATYLYQQILRSQHWQQLSPLEDYSPLLALQAVQLFLNSEKNSTQLKLINFWLNASLMKLIKNCETKIINLWLNQTLITKKNPISSLYRWVINHVSYLKNYWDYLMFRINHMIWKMKERDCTKLDLLYMSCSTTDNILYSIKYKFLSPT